MKTALFLLSLYPRSWRERYEEELLDLLEQRPISLRDGIDLCFGALDAHLHPELGTTGMTLYERMIHMFFTMRRSLLTIFCAFIGFVLAGWAFQKMTEYNDFVEVAQTHSMIGIAFNLVVIGGIIAVLAVVAGGLPIVFAVVRSAFAHKRYGPLFLLAVPVLAFAWFMGTIFVLKALSHASQSAASNMLLLDRGLFLSTLIVAAIISAVAICFAVARSQIPAQILRFAFYAGMLTTTAMVLILSATIVWGLSLRDGAPHLFAGNDGILASSTLATWLGIVVAMAITATLAVFSLLRGFSARTTLRGATNS